MIDGQKDSEAGLADKGERTNSITQEERAEKKGKVGDNKAGIVQEKREQ